jgi:serine/threonine-protein phosphatase Stp1
MTSWGGNLTVANRVQAQLTSPTHSGRGLFRAPYMLAHMVSAARTHPGRARRVNEDGILARDDLGLWAVADGMGGGRAGNWAAATMLDALSRVAAATRDAVADALDRAITEGNAEIVAAAPALGGMAGTTVAALRVDGHRLSGVWVGDSRIYRLRHGQLSLLTRDHSIVQELVDRGAITADEAGRHPMAHVLSRAVGVQPAVEPAYLGDDMEPGDRYLICSDGLSRTVPEDTIAERLSMTDASEAADRLLDDALEAGAPDNVSVIVISYDPTPQT